jgi:hypothetical protein
MVGDSGAKMQLTPKEKQAPGRCLCCVCVRVCVLAFACREGGECRVSVSMCENAGREIASRS